MLCVALAPSSQHAERAGGRPSPGLLRGPRCSPEVLNTFPRTGLYHLPTPSLLTYLLRSQVNVESELHKERTLILFTSSSTSTSDTFIKSLPINEHLFSTYCIPSTIGTGLGPRKTAENKAGEASAFTGLPGLCVRWAMNVTSKSR